MRHEQVPGAICRFTCVVIFVVDHESHHLKIIKADWTDASFGGHGLHECFLEHGAKVLLLLLLVSHLRERYTMTGNGEKKDFTTLIRIKVLPTGIFWNERTVERREIKIRMQRLNKTTYTEAAFPDKILIDGLLRASRSIHRSANNMITRSFKSNGSDIEMRRRRDHQDGS